MTQLKCAFILLAGGQGTRFGSDLPKQYTDLKGKPLVLHAFEVFQQCEQIDEIVVVCGKEYQSFFSDVAKKPIKFAASGHRRQDSVENGFKEVSADADIICIHDGARPYPTKQMVVDVLDAAHTYGAAAVGMPVKFTLKDCDGEGMVVSTPDRSRFWEIQTPQALRRALLTDGLALATKAGLTVTDDTSLAELMGAKVKIVPGSYSNIKVTTPEDLLIAERLHV
jgi:2-C-methyl-D-erythritol 4-phosphate cytidylyltransferase